MTYWILSIFVSIVVGQPVIDENGVVWEVEEVQFYGVPAKTKKECAANIIKVMEQTDPYAPRMSSVKCVPAEIGDFPKLEKIYELIDDDYVDGVLREIPANNEHWQTLEVPGWYGTK